MKSIALIAWVAAVLTLSVDARDTGHFVRVFWYERGIEHGNPDFNSRFRVNAPESVLHPTFKNRVETRGNGMMLIRADEDLSLIAGAELYAELWGGHPGTANKRVIINGRSLYSIPEIGTAEKNCTHQYPVIALKPADLVNGYNAVQFACDQGTTFWGHFIVDNAALRLRLGETHPLLQEKLFRDFNVSVNATASFDDSDKINLGLNPDSAAGWPAIERVDYYGRYSGYDENGDGKTNDWHGFTKKRMPVGIIGSSSEPPFAVAWDTSMLPAQSNVAVKAVVRFKEWPGVEWVTKTKDGLEIPKRHGMALHMVPAMEVPKPFWSRAGRTNRCVIRLEVPPEAIERAELHVVVWDGGAGNVRDYFTLNGRPLSVAGNGRHDVIYSVVNVEPSVLKSGENVIELLSDTDHHGIEVLMPGPMLVVRARSER